MRETPRDRGEPGPAVIVGRAPGQHSVCHQGMPRRRLTGNGRGLLLGGSYYLRAFGVTSLVLDQFRPALTVEVWASPAAGAASPISLGST